MTTFQNNEQADLALQYIQCTDQHLFLTGKAGTGKTTFLKRLREISPKRMIVVAPTGVAAINAEGVTIHSFFSLPFTPFIPKEARVENESERQYRFSHIKIDILRSLDLLVIDEISMVRADILDAIDEVLRRYKNKNKPFGGVQLLMIGDLQQLPPVVTDADSEVLKRYYDTNFFYGSRALSKTRFVTIELQHIYRQSEAKFIGLLNAVRDNQLSPEVIDLLRQRTIPGFQADDYIMLTTHNHQAQRINDQRLKELKNASWFFKAKVTGDFPESSYPTDFELELKPGARVMFLKNDSSPEKAYFNGKIGVITSIDDETIYVQSEGEERIIAVHPMEWNNMQYTIDDATQEIVETVIGTFEQYPLKLAWAITIHKSQGLTFDKVVIDARAAFAHGQVYVALSRCRSLDGLVLSTPVHQNSLVSNSEIEQFTRQQKANAPSQESLRTAQQYYMQELLIDLFDFTPLQKEIINLIYRLRENEQVVSGNIHVTIRNTKEFVNQEIVEIGIKFHSQINELIAQNGDVENNPLLQERIRKATFFFGEKIDRCMADVDALEFETDNKAIRKSISDALDKLKEQIVGKKQALKSCADGFRLSEYLSARAKAILKGDKPETEKYKPASLKSSAHPDLLLKLRAWRNATADQQNVQPYDVLRQKSMDELIAKLPTNKKLLKSIKGFGAKRIREYGDELIDIITGYMQEKGLAIVVETDEKEPEGKVSTFDVTYNLFTSGLNAAAIAKERGLTLTTIEGHLARFVKEEKIDIAVLLPDDKLRKALDYFKSAETVGLTPAYEALQGALSYGELKYVLSYLNRP
ncbi:helix-turn-helix domain-containing protein [Paludibacter sp.]|uniref:helix-turn-helix domain-containing protein n=1 Tax=Paludibacter sp. TaxID=1898105 RepID=UPI001355779E|nr:helix-turn-helix domain-containing protein [Paludibacter sp.]MTK54158.1 AAA family ATPase [Paludibacter sp.]